MSLKDKNVVVTGRSRGLGLGLVEALVAHGARVAVVARGADALESVRARLLWFMAKYANGVAKQKGLGIRFQAILPMQIIGGTGVGDVGASAYARAMGIETEAFLARFGAPMPPRQFGDYLVAVLDDPRYATGFTSA
jgi:short chain dehydrogenase